LFLMTARRMERKHAQKKDQQDVKPGQTLTRHSSFSGSCHELCVHIVENGFLKELQGIGSLWCGWISAEGGEAFGQRSSAIVKEKCVLTR